MYTHTKLCYTIPYVHSFSPGLKNVVPRYEVRTAFIAPNKLSHLCLRAGKEIEALVIILTKPVVEKSVSYKDY